MWLEVTHYKTYQDFIAKALILFQNIGLQVIEKQVSRTTSHLQESNS
jgi:hypothetical protein